MNCNHCDKPTKAKGLCNAHYQKLRKYGDPLVGTTNMRGYSKMAQYLAKVDKRGTDDCWPWTGGTSYKGYGVFADGKGGSGKAHRYGFNQLVRPLELGETVDHTCHNRSQDCPGGNTCPHRACQNPSHWEAVPALVNGARGKSFSAENARKARCDRGHELTADNSYGYKGRRQCKTCAQEDARARAGSPAYKQDRKNRYAAARAAGFSPAEARRMR